MESIRKVLASNGYSEFCYHIERVQLNGFVYSNLFFATCEKGASIVVKVRSQVDYQIKDSLKYLRLLSDPSCCVVRYLDCIVVDGYIYLIMSKIEGRQPILNGREDLPRFFRALGELNAINPHPGPFTSMYVSGQVFGTIRKLVEFEVSQYFHSYKGKYNEEWFLSKVASAWSSSGCLILEDMHPGNMMIDQHNRPLFLDSEYLTSGLSRVSIKRHL